MRFRHHDNPNKLNKSSGRTLLVLTYLEEGQIFDQEKEMQQLFKT